MSSVSPSSSELISDWSSSPLFAPPLSFTAEAAVARFKAFLRIRTISSEGHLTGANQSAVSFLQTFGRRLGLKHQIFTYTAGRPVLVLSLFPSASASTSVSTSSTEGSILLNSHYDVVPVMVDNWTVPPFEATENQQGEIIARGTQDMKCVCIQYLEALGRLLAPQLSALSVQDQSDPSAFIHSPYARPLHLSYMPDEEIGGTQGMLPWIESEEFKQLNVIWGMDEGIAHPDKNNFTCFFGERSLWWIKVKANGPTGHASRFIENPATQKLHSVISEFLSFRASQESRLLAGHSHHTGECSHAQINKLNLGDVITLNLTMLKSGVTNDNGQTYNLNVIPQVAEAGFDIRLPPSVNITEFEELLKKWCAKEQGVEYEYILKLSAEEITTIDKNVNPFMKEFEALLAQNNYTLHTSIFPAGTDSRYLRKAKIPIIGFSPLHGTPILLHDHNERIHKDIFEQGIQLYTQIIPTFMKVAATVDSTNKQPLVKAADKLPFM